MSTARKLVSGELCLTQAVAATRETLFGACSTVQGLEGWYADVVEGPVRVGETLKLIWPEVGASMPLRVTELTPGNRVVFEGQGSRVTLEVEEGVIHLHHEGVPESTLEGLRSSWKVALATLAHGLEWHRGKRRVARWAVRQVNATSELLHLCFTEPRALRRWLGESTGIGAAGEPFSLLWNDGRTVTGHVLAETQGRDVAVSLNELERSVLALRTLPASARSCHVALSWSSWGTAREEAVRAELLRALDRLCGLLSRGGAG